MNFNVPASLDKEDNYIIMGRDQERVRAKEPKETILSRDIY